jgi:uncharacterized membrane protein
MLTMVRVGLLALLALQILWHGLLPVPRSALGWSAFAIAVVPLLLLLPGAWRARPAPLFWANLVCLLYFCHGVSEAWTEPAMRGWAFLEIALSVTVVSAYGAFGLRSRRAARAAQNGPAVDPRAMISVPAPTNHPASGPAANSSF